MSQFSRFIGSERGEFGRVCAAFEALGYSPPRPDHGSTGAFASTIVSQYLSDMTVAECLAVIRFGLSTGSGFIASVAGRWTLADVLRMGV